MEREIQEDFSNGPKMEHRLTIVRENRQVHPNLVPNYGVGHDRSSERCHLYLRLEAVVVCG